MLCLQFFPEFLKQNKRMNSSNNNDNSRLTTCIPGQPKALKIKKCVQNRMKRHGTTHHK